MASISSIYFRTCNLLKTMNISSSLFHITNSRTLYSALALGLESFERTKQRTRQHFVGIDEKFKNKMKDFTSEGSKNMVFTEDLKNMVYLLNNSEEDLSLLETMLIKFNQQNKELRFGTFVFGPVILRTYYILNKPLEAYRIFKNPELDGFFDQIVSYQILMDLLFNNNMFEEVIDVYNTLIKKQLMGSKYHKHPTVLVFAACYKQNTPDSYDYIKTIWTDMQKIGHTPITKTLAFAAALAINQNAPHEALEIISTTERQNYVTIRNLKVAALADIARPEDAFPILRRILELDIPVEKKQTFCEEAIEKLRLSVEKDGTKDLVTEFNRIDQQLTVQGHIGSEPLSSLLCSTMNYDPNNRRPNENNRLAASFGFNPVQKNYRKREGLSDLG